MEFDERLRKDGKGQRDNAVGSRSRKHRHRPQVVSVLLDLPQIVGTAVIGAALLQRQLGIVGSGVVPTKIALPWPMPQLGLTDP